MRAVAIREVGLHAENTPDRYTKVHQGDDRDSGADQMQHERTEYGRRSFGFFGDENHQCWQKGKHEEQQPSSFRHKGAQHIDLVAQVTGQRIAEAVDVGPGSGRMLLKAGGTQEARGIADEEGEQTAERKSEVTEGATVFEKVEIE